jgi:glutamate-ammonia-ligase adenylyltransferase
MSLAQNFYSPEFDAPLFTAFLHSNGFPDEKRATQLLRYVAKSDEEKAALTPIFEDLIYNLGESADPALALLNFTNLCDRIADKTAFFVRLEKDPAAFRRLTKLLSWSQSLSDSVIRDVNNLELIFEGAKPISRPALRALANEQNDLDALRHFRKAQFLRIGLLDLESDTWRDAEDFHLVTRQISDLAQVVIQRALDLIAGDDQRGFCAILMGKGGARELNYSSDVDLIFLSEDREDALQIGEKLLRVLGDITASGFLWRADMRLRPDGRNGTLVTPFGYALSYYESYAAAWEWQALIKARVVAGDARLGRRFRKFTRGITWARRSDDSHLREVFEMKKRSEKTADGQNPRNLKSGPGGIRDAEWIAQQLQMMLGPSHPRARSASMLRALDVLDELDALSPDETLLLRDSYLWLRVAEHRLQIWNEQAIRDLPQKEEEKAALARRLGCNWRGKAAAQFLEEEKERHSKDVRDLTERIFWAFSTESCEDWLQQIFGDKKIDTQTQARLDRLASGTQTRPLPAPLSRQIRAVLPGAFSGFERAAESERALIAFENLAEASGNRLSLFRSLDGSKGLSQAIWTILGGSTFLSDTLVKFPQLLDLAANRALLTRGRSRDEARFACRDYCYPFRDSNAALRRWRARELLRIGLRDLVMDISPLEITAEISYLANACLDFALEATRNSLTGSAGMAPISILGMGKFGGFEMHYASDCDVIFVCENDASSAAKFAEAFIKFCGGHTADGTLFEVDARLRPYGKSGPLVTTIGALREYFERPELGFATWERQAFTRCRRAVGDIGTGAKAMALIKGAAFPESWQASWSDELRHIKGRVEAERAGKGFKTGVEIYDVKLGAGTLSDIEWIAQWLAMKYGAGHPYLQTPNTLYQLEAAQEAGLISTSEFAVLKSAFLWLHRAQLRHQIAREGGAGAVKSDSGELKIWAKALFPEMDESAALERFKTEWKNHTEQTRTIFEQVRDAL